jgi:hypothetical protein
VKRSKVRALLVGCLLAVGGSAGAQTATQRISGDVAAMKGHQLEVKTATGQVVTVRLADNVRISARSAADLGALAPGAFIGTTAIAQSDGTLKAVEVHVFPESMRGTGEGHRPMDAKPGSTMTNATVTNVTATGKVPPRNTTTNATVASVAASGPGRRITLKYKDGEKTVVVDHAVPVVMVQPGDRSLLVPGAHVLVTATRQSDGTLASDRVSVGKNGLVPPI